MSCKFLTLLITIAVVILCSLANISKLVAATDEQLSSLAMENRELRQADLVEDLQDPIKYLERLDKIYSQMTRPRFGRSTGGILASKHPSQVSLEKTRQSMRLALLEAAASRAANQNTRTKLGLANLISSLASQPSDLDL